jgi:predicted enzyme related to lactoylglutathione lyase
MSHLILAKPLGGSIIVREDLKPTIEGGNIYLNAFGKLSDAVSKVENAGGKVIVPFMDLGKFGFFCHNY